MENQKHPRENPTCRHCGVEFERHASGASTYCSPLCLYLHDGSRALSVRIVCATCGGPIKNIRREGRGRHAEYCSKRCHDSRLATKDCPVCGASFTRGRALKTCGSPSCVSAMEQFMRDVNPPATLWACHLEQMTCVICGAGFVRGAHSPRHGAVQCGMHSAAELQRWQLKNNPETRHQDRERTSRRRALRCGAEVEKFQPREIFERDNYRCHLCGKPTLREVSGRHPLAPSLDHIVPLSLGGSHSRANTACAHLVCNVAKGNRSTGREQLRLLG